MTATIEVRPPPTCDRCGKVIEKDGVIGKRGIYCSTFCAFARGEEVV